jgi:hypothetical protein
MASANSKNPQKLPRWILVAALFSFLVLMWIMSIYFVSVISIPRQGLFRGMDFNSLASLLFGAASVALFLLSIFIAIVALIGWGGLLGTMRKNAQDAAKEEVGSLQNELRGRALMTMGYLIGEMNVDPFKLRPMSQDSRDNLAEAVSLCEQAFNLLKKDEGSPAAYMALNNFVFYSCLSGEESRHGFLLEKAGDLRRVGQEHGAPKLLLTSCRVILELGTDAAEKREACKILRALAGKSQISEKERKEARLYIDEFCQWPE